MRKSRLGCIALVAIVAGASCGTREPSALDTPARTKNLSVGSTPPTVTQQPNATGTTTPESQCSPEGRIHSSNPVEVPPPEENSDEQSFSSGECSFYGRYKNVMAIGVYTFRWSGPTTKKPVVVEVSRDGIVWKALETRWSPTKPNSATAKVTLTGNLFVRVRPAAG